MSVVDIQFGPLTHKRLMNRTKHELANDVLSLIKERDEARMIADIEMDKTIAAKRDRFTLDQIEAWLVSTPMHDDGDTSAVLERVRIGINLRGPEHGLAASVKKESE